MYKGTPKSVLQHKIYDKLLKEMEYCKSELEFQKEIVESYTQPFVRAQQDFCSKHEVNLMDLIEINQTRLASLEKSTQALAPTPKPPNKKKFSKIYKQIALRAHPDLRQDSDDDEDFKKASEAYRSGDWSSLLQIFSRLGLRPEQYPKDLFPDMEEHIAYLKRTIERNQQTYVWKYYQCDGDVDCIEALIKSMLLHAYNYKID